MTIAALALIMIGRQVGCVTLLAILVMGVVKSDLCPVSYVMAVIASSLFIVGLGCFGLVAGQAVSQPHVVHVDSGPVLHVAVAPCANSRQVLFRRFLMMAGFALGGFGVIVGELGPIFYIGVAQGASAGIMKERCLLDVAGFTFADVGVVVTVQGPISCVAVAKLAVAGVVNGGYGRFREVDQNNLRQYRSWLVLSVTGQAFGNAFVVKLIGFPGERVMTQIARAIEMLRIELPEGAGSIFSRWQRVAIGTNGGGVGVLAILVAAFTGWQGVAHG